MIRPARPEDAAAIRAIAEAAYAPFIPLIGRRPAPMDADFPAQIAAGRVWAAEGEAQGQGASEGRAGAILGGQLVCDETVVPGKIALELKSVAAAIVIGGQSCRRLAVSAVVV